MRVQVHRDAELRVPKDIHDNAGGHALSQQERGTGVPKVVHPDATNTSLHDKRVQSSREVSGLHGGAGGGCEDKAGVLPIRDLTLELLSGEMLCRTSAITAGIGMSRLDLVDFGGPKIMPCPLMR